MEKVVQRNILREESQIYTIRLPPYYVGQATCDDNKSK